MKINIISQAIAQGRKYVRQNPEKVRQATQKAGDFVDAKTGHKHSDKIAKARDAADSFIEKQR